MAAVSKTHASQQGKMGNLDFSSRSAERSARAVCEPRVGPSELQTRSSHLYIACVQTSPPGGDVCTQANLYKVALIHKVHEVALIQVVRKRVSFQDRKNENTPKFPSIKI